MKLQPLPLIAPTLGKNESKNGADDRNSLIVNVSG